MKSPGTKTILVTGGGGYIGTVLTEMLLAAGYQVIVLDRFFFGNTLDDLQKDAGLRLVEGDIRTVSPTLFEGVYGVCDLAALNNDPAGELDPKRTLDINYRGRARICSLAKQAGVERYILASSCSIYGFQDDIVDETSAVNPLTTYAKANYRTEQECLPKADKDFCVTSLRQSTVYGASRRMRFDLAINGMTLSAYGSGVVKLLRDGTQWRPMVHVRDTAQAFLAVLEAAVASINGQIFNVGSEEQNLQLHALTERICKTAGIPHAIEWYGDPDVRSYRVSFKKIVDTLGYHTKYTPEDGVHEIMEGLKQGTLKDELVTYTVKWYKYLIEADQHVLAPRREGHSHSI